MSDSISGVPGHISIMQTPYEPRLTILHNSPEAPFEIPIFPLSADPSQAWDLRIVDGVLEWVLVAEEQQLNFNDPSWLVF